MCAITGIFTEKSNVCLSLYNALTVLQHRGQDAAGMATCDNNGTLKLHKDNGLVRDVFDEKTMISLKGQYGLAHTRYPTAGTSSNIEAQPFYVNSPFGLVLVHNGNLVNASELSSELYSQDLRHLNTSSDSEVLLNVFAHALHNRSTQKLNISDIFLAVDEVHERVEGAYAVIVMILGYGILAFRDPNGIRPLIYGSKKGKNHMFSSESVALDCLGYNQDIEDLKPGEAIFIDIQGNKSNHIYKKSKGCSPCIFEYVYLARPDSTMDNINVYNSRLSMGKYLAKKDISISKL